MPWWCFCCLALVCLVRMPTARRFNHVVNINMPAEPVRALLQVCRGRSVLLACEHGAHRSAGTAALLLTACGPGLGRSAGRAIVVVLCTALGCDTRASPDFQYSCRFAGLPRFRIHRPSPTHGIAPDCECTGSPRLQRKRLANWRPGHRTVPLHCTVTGSCRCVAPLCSFHGPARNAQTIGKPG